MREWKGEKEDMGTINGGRKECEKDVVGGENREKEGRWERKVELECL